MDEVKSLPDKTNNEIRIVDEKTKIIDGIKYIVLLDNVGRMWVNLESIGKECGYKNPANAINKLYNRNKDAFTNKVIKRQTVVLGRPRLFFNNEGVITAKLHSRMFRKQPKRLEELAKFLSQVDSGELKIIHKDDAEKLKQQLQPHLVLGQDLTVVMKRLDEIEALIRRVNTIQALPDKNLMDVPRKKIIGWLLVNMAKDFGVLGHEVWWDFSEELGIDNYGKQPKTMFPRMLTFFFERHPRLVVRAHNWYMSEEEPTPEIQEEFLLLFEKAKQAKLDVFSEEEGVSEFT